MTKKERNFQRYQRATWIHPAAYPLDQPVDSTLYRPVATWVGRLVLPPPGERDPEGGCIFELHHAPPPYTEWVGQSVRLRYSPNRLTQARTWAVTRHVIFNQRAEKMADDGLVLAERINRWRLVTPLESLAAGHPEDDIIVRLVDPVVVDETADGQVLLVDHDPVQISGRYVGLVTFVEPSTEVEHGWRVRHFNPRTHSFDGAERVVTVPPPILDENGTSPSTSAAINQSPLNEAGWYIYGAPGVDGRFLVQAWTPRVLLRLEPERVITGEEASWRYVRHEAWENVAARKGTVTSVLCDPRAHNPATASAAWQEGDSALVLHVYSGIGGKQREPHARAFLYFGHFSFGVADVIYEPLADELRFDITYYQIYTHNTDGLVAGALDWSRYMRLVGLSYAPLVFGFLILMPYLGPFVQRVLFAWSFVIALRAVAYTFAVGFWPALLCVGLGWLLLVLLTASVGRPVAALRNWVWHRITGTPMDSSAHELLQQFAMDQSTPPATKGDQP